MADLPNAHDDDVMHGTAAAIFAGHAPEAAADESPADIVQRVPFLHPDDAKRLGLLVVVANWCGHCRNFKPRLEAVKNWVRTHNIGVDVVEHEDRGGESDLPPHIASNTRGFPTIMPIVNGVPISWSEMHAGRDAADFFNSFRATFRPAIEAAGDPAFTPPIEGGFVGEIGFTPVEWAPLAGGRRRKRKAKGKAVNINPSKNETREFDGDEPVAEPVSELHKQLMGIAPLDRCVLLTLARDPAFRGADAPTLVGAFQHGDEVDLIFEVEGRDGYLHGRGRVTETSCEPLSVETVSRDDGTMLMFTMANDPANVDVKDLVSNEIISSA